MKQVYKRFLFLGTLMFFAVGICSANATSLMKEKNLSSRKSQEADMRITKEVDNLIPFVGETIGFTLKVYNHGPDDATSVEVTDYLPDGYEYVEDNANGLFDANTNTWSLQISQVAVGEMLEISILAAVLPDGNYENIASVSADEFDPDLSDNTASVTTFPVAEGNLRLVKQTNTTRPLAESEFEFTFAVTNLGAGHVSGIVLKDTLSNGFSHLDASAEKGSFTIQNGIMHWEMDKLLQGETVFVYRQVRVENTPEALFGNPSWVISDQSEDYVMEELTVSPVFAPLANDLEVMVPYNQQKRIHVLENDLSYNDDFDVSSLILLEGPVSGANAQVHSDGSITLDYTQMFEFSGADFFVYEISNAFGLSDNARVDVLVETPLLNKELIPNTFSANQNGFNDYFVIPGIEDQPTTKLSVFNRYGSLVFEMPNYDNSWDGTDQNSGADLPVGTYYYVLDMGNGNDIIKGSIYITR